jgi:hypothetical protein
MSKLRLTLFVLLLGAPALATEHEQPAPSKPATDASRELAPDPYGNGARLNLTSDGQSYLRFLSWVQVWARYVQNNPGTLVAGEPRKHDFDVGIRRARLLLLGQLTSRVQVVTHLGINSQNFIGARKPQVFFHDVWVQFRLLDEHLFVGGGLHYWNGISRMTNASTLNLMAVDLPLVHLPTLERTDQLGRMLGLWAKGKLGPFDYRLALNRPFAAGPEQPGPQTDFNPNAGTLALAGYLQWQFLERESNALPYMTGSYLGTKRVLNLGAGFLFHPRAMWAQPDAASAPSTHDMLAGAVDLFADLPLADGALTGYAAFCYYDLGPDYVRSIGLLNSGSAGSSFNGAGNAYPVIGSGPHLYGQLGYLIRQWQLQPYVTLQSSFFAALDDPALIVEAGANLYLIGHHAKVTLHYRNRPVYGPSDGGTIGTRSRRSEVILQGMVFM